jgi:tRNA pseudouridine38-40 synthase
MVRYQVILSYDGTEFKGFQRQRRKTRTVQVVVEDALRKLGWQGKSILAAGRTDTGVHAAGQVIAFDLDWAHAPIDLQRALNANLPMEVSALAVFPAASRFHPRYDAAWREYRYLVYCQEARHPLLERYAWRVWPAIELEKLRQAARLLAGQHDFAAFGTPPRAGSSTMRTIYQAAWEEAQPYFVFAIRADAFLYHMVRRLVMLQVRIGQGLLPVEQFQSSLEPGAAPVQGLAPAQGLCLMEVYYGEGER